ncbi:aspartate/glutamate racemase family protein [Tropicibacter sp. S64]|uniref:aspartate/glutamate racemase family protein n=1 Tax=Tropicibacter sp. S64 TaxID=3415122 RepID=UPI003C7B1047
MPGVILMNPNSNAATTDAMVAIASQILPDVTGWTAPGGPGMITGPDALDAAARLIGQAELPPADGVIVSAFGDPGRAELARRLVCPVVGIGEAAAQEAAAFGAFAVATTTPGLQSRIDALMTERAGAARYVGCVLTAGDPLDLMRDAAALDAALMDATLRAAQAGAQAVIVGGGPLGEAADRLSPHAPVPLIAPIRAAARMMAARLGQSGKT